MSRALFYSMVLILSLIDIAVTGAEKPPSTTSMYESKNATRPQKFFRGNQDISEGDNQKDRKSNITQWVIFGIVGIIVLAIVLGLYLFMKYRGAQEQEQQTKNYEVTPDDGGGAYQSARK